MTLKEKHKVQLDEWEEEKQEQHVQLKAKNKIATLKVKVTNKKQNKTTKVAALPFGG